MMRPTRMLRLASAVVRAAERSKECRAILANCQPRIKNMIPREIAQRNSTRDSVVHQAIKSCMRPQHKSGRRAMDAAAYTGAQEMEMERCGRSNAAIPARRRDHAGIVCSEKAFPRRA